MDDIHLSQSDEWVISVKDGLLKEFERPHRNQEKRNRGCTIFRVPEHVKNRPEGKNLTVYTPAGISLGLFHIPGRYDAPKRGEKFKLKMASAFLSSKYKLGSSGNDSDSWKTDKSGKLWQDLCKSLGGRDVLKFKECYDLHEDDIIKEPEQVLQCALTLDAIIVGCLFWVYSYEDNVGSTRFPFKAIKACAEELKYSGIPKEDFLKLENQIPLKLLGNVLQVLDSETTSDEHLNRACASFATSFVKYFPGYDLAQDYHFIDGLEHKKEFLKCDHLLHCAAIALRRSEENDFGLYKGHLSQSMKRDEINSCLSTWCFKPWKGRSDAPKEESSTFNIPCATLLREAGIEVQGRSRGPKSDLLPIFERGWFCKATLYIPRLPILPAVTWTLWRNVLVYEYEKNCQLKEKDRQESQIHAFLALMACLVDTHEDVLLFTQGANPVLPEGYQSSPELLVEMFKSGLKGLPFADYMRWVALANQINKFCKQRYRRLVLDTWRKNFGKPWLAASVTAAIFLLGCAVVQATYAVLAYRKSLSSSPSGSPPS